MLAISGIDGDGRLRVGVLFDDDNLEAALSELEVLSTGPDLQ
jgi:hypothetical protein